MTINLILNLARGYLSLYYNYSKIQLSKLFFFQNLIKDVILFKDMLLNINKLSNEFVTNLQSCKKERVNLKNTLGLLQRQSLVKIKACIFKPGLAF